VRKVEEDRERKTKKKAEGKKRAASPEAVADHPWKKPSTAKCPKRKKGSGGKAKGKGR